uniref:Uncharacterized protein n=1 Tax=Rhizophora mucronata TaxID=61149 RepID=A0A2P2K5S4_RHIMU
MKSGISHTNLHLVLWSIFCFMTVTCTRTRNPKYQIIAANIEPASLLNAYHLQIPGASVLLNVSISSYFEPCTKPHNSTCLTSKSSECARHGFP